MNVCFAILYYPTFATTATPEQYLKRMVLQDELPRALAARGHSVDVVHAYPTEHMLERDGVRHHFVAPGPIAHLSGRMAQLVGREPAMFEPALRAARRIRALQPDIIHFHGMILTWNLALLQGLLGASAPPIVLHYHGGFPPHNPLARWVLRRSFARTKRQFFTTRTHAQPFVEAGMLRDDNHLVELIETSSNFQPIPKATARGITGMHGDPLYLWVGRLHPIKDPLTALRAFAMVAPAQLGARLYLHYLTNELEPEMRSFIASQPHLAERVEFRGRVAFEQMPAIYSSADLMLQSSLREFSGCAILEGMACGAIPVISDIPSFRMMTGNGQVGSLFPVGDAQSLAAQLLAIPADAISRHSQAVRAYFVAELSFAAMAAQLEQVYREIASSAAAE